MKKSTLLLGIFALFSVAACGRENTVTCTPVFAAPQPYLNSQNSYKCPLGQVLVGYDQGAVGGPLLCASMTVSCPVPEK